MKNRNKIIIASSIVLAGTLTFILINRSRKKKQVGEIMRIINEGIGEGGDLTDYLGGVSTPDVKIIKADPNAKSRATNAANKIMLAKGGYLRGDDEDAVYDALRSLRSIAELKLTSNIIYSTKKQTLQSFLASFLDSAEMAKVNEIIAKLK